MTERQKDIDILDDMLVALVDLLEKKGVVTHAEWERLIKSRLKDAHSLTDFKDLR
ncbi:MAG: hypothetical protein ABSB53_00525 [Nitrososphaerales archaeon]|jgi:hypothetical protein